jgi:hypothetical protein
MNAVTFLFAGLLIVCLGAFGLAVKAMMSSVFRPLGGKIRMTSSLFVGMFTVLVCGVMAVVSLGVLFSALGLLTNALIAAFLCSASTALQVTRAFTQPAVVETAATEPSAQAAESRAASAEATEANAAAPAVGAPAVAAAATAASSEVDPMDAWAAEQVKPAPQPVVSKPPYHGASLETMEDRHEHAYDIDDAIASQYQPPVSAPVASMQAPAEAVSAQVPDLVDTAEALVRADTIDRAETYADVTPVMDTFDVSPNVSSFSHTGQQDFSLQPA